MVQCTLEFGSGLSTLLFANNDVRHTAIEEKPEIARDGGASVQLVGRGEDGWYDWQPVRPYDLVLIDGPQGEGNRGGVLGVIKRLVHDETVIIVDDVHRASEMLLTRNLVSLVGHDPILSIATRINRFAIISEQMQPTSECLDAHPL